MNNENVEKNIIPKHLEKINKIIIPHRLIQFKYPTHGRRFNVMLREYLGEE